VSVFKELFLEKAPILLKPRDSSFPAVSSVAAHLLTK